MDIKLLKCVQDSILATPGQYNQGLLFQNKNCYGPASIPAWICWLGLTRGELLDEFHNGCIRRSAAEIARLDDDVADKLFHPDPLGNGDAVAAVKVAGVLGHLIETGEVDWSAEYKPPAIDRFMRRMLRGILDWEDSRE